MPCARKSNPVPPGSGLLMTAVLTVSRRQVAGALGFAAGIDQSRPPGVTVQHLIAAKINQMVRGEFGINPFIQFAVAGVSRVQRLVAAVVLRQLLFDDIRLDGHAEVIGLSTEIGAGRDNPFPWF